MLSRRRLLALASAGLMMPAPQALAAIGRPGLPLLVEEIARMRGIEEGVGRPVHVVVSPGCDKAGGMLATTRGFLDRVRLRWVPVQWSPTDRDAVGLCLSRGTVEALHALLEGRPGDGKGDPILADRQQALYEGVARLLWESTGRTPATPTFVVPLSGRRVQVVRGALTESLFEDLLTLPL